MSQPPDPHLAAARHAAAASAGAARLRPPEALAYVAYTTLLRLATPLYLARVAWRGRQEPGYVQDWPARLGWGLPQIEPGALWLHAVSLGETRAAAPLIEALRAARPGLRLLLTHTTATGRAAGQALLRPGDVQTWLPYDTPGAVRRFLRATRPALGVLMETEIWPVLLHEARRAGVPMVLANARLSERSARRGRKLAALLHPVGRALATALAQTPQDAVRLLASGVPSAPVCGNLKYDITPAPAQLAQGRRWREALGRPVLLFANTREGEEAALLALWRTLHAQHIPQTEVGAEVVGRAGPMPDPLPLLALVPRHPQRFEAVATLVQQAGLSLARRSQWQAQPPATAHAADVWLGDSLGELPLYYAAADVALLGGSFEPLGGHNLIEAAACGCPIVLGPSTFNFAEAAELAIAAGAAWRASGLEDALRQALALLADEPRRRQAAQAATGFSAAHRGAAQRMAQAVLAFSAPAAG